MERHARAGVESHGATEMRSDQFRLRFANGGNFNFMRFEVELPLAFQVVAVCRFRRDCCPVSPLIWHIWMRELLQINIMILVREGQISAGRAKKCPTVAGKMLEEDDTDATTHTPKDEHGIGHGRLGPACVCADPAQEKSASLSIMVDMSASRLADLDHGDVDSVECAGSWPSTTRVSSRCARLAGVVQDGLSPGSSS